MHDECNMPDATPDPTSDTPPKKPRFRLRYSLRSLLIFVLLVNCACLLWMHWAPWTLDTTLRGHAAQINSVAFSPDGKRLVTGSHDQAAIVWDVFTGKRLMVIKPEMGHVLHVGYSRNGKRIFTSSSRMSVAWDAETGKLHGRAPQYYFKSLRWLSVSQDGTQYAIGGNGRGVTIGKILQPPKPAWEGKPIYGWLAHDAEVLSLDFSYDGKRLVTASKDGLAKIWRYRHPEQWWGLLYVPAFWMTLTLAALLVWSLLRDWRTLQQKTPASGNG